MHQIFAFDFTYHNDPKFSDRFIWANSADPDQTAPRGAVWSGSSLFAIPFALFRGITPWLNLNAWIVQCLQCMKIQELYDMQEMQGMQHIKILQ